jgi:glycosyltransferase involved in cell wall biosynthesis
MPNLVLHLVKDFSPPSQTFIYDLVHSLEKDSPSPLHVVGYYRKRLLADQRRCREVVSVAKRRDVLGRIVRLFRFSGNASKEISSNLNGLIKNLNPQIIHAHFAWTVWDLLIPYSQFYHLEIPVLISIHGTDLLKTAKQSETKRLSLIDFSENFNTRFTVANDFMVNELEMIGIPKKKIHKVQYSISNHFLSKDKIPSTKNSSANHDPYRIVCTGRLVNWKGQCYLIKAVSQLIKKAKIRCILTLIGDGPERKRLEILARDLQIGDSVHFNGFVDHAKIPTILSSQDVYVQPSIYDKVTGQCEAFGISILEAISCGLLVIASRSGGIPDVIGEENEHARLVKPADTDELYSALLDFYQSKGSRKDNSAYIKERLNSFSKEKQRNEVLSAYASLLTP